MELKNGIEILVRQAVSQNVCFGSTQEPLGQP